MMKWLKKLKSASRNNAEPTVEPANLHYAEPTTPSPVTFTLDGCPRNPERIDVVLARLKQAWERDPDLRLGQLIFNLAEAWQDSKFRMYSIEDAALYDRLGMMLGLQSTSSASNAPADGAG